MIVLAYFGELTTSELNLPLGTIKGRMRLGLAKLREDVADAGGGTRTPDTRIMIPLL